LKRTAVVMGLLQIAGVPARAVGRSGAQLLRRQVHGASHQLAVELRQIRPGVELSGYQLGGLAAETEFDTLLDR
jgi:hypothetical protein